VGRRTSLLVWNVTNKDVLRRSFQSSVRKRCVPSQWHYAAQSLRSAGGGEIVRQALPTEGAMSQSRINRHNVSLVRLDDNRLRDLGQAAMQADKRQSRWAEMLEKRVILTAASVIVVAGVLDHSSDMWTKW
jgi:hypothetical protein